MTKQPELVLSHEEAKAEILALRERIMSVQVLNFFGRLFLRDAQNTSIIYWVSNLFISNLLGCGLCLVLTFYMNEFNGKQFLWKGVLFSTEMAFLGLVVNYYLIRRFLRNISSQFVPKIINVNDLSDLVLWLRDSWSFRNVLLFVLGFELMWLGFGIGAMSIVDHDFVGYAFSLAMIFNGFITGVAFHGVFWTGLFVFNLKKYQYDLNSFAPADSQIIADITDNCNTLMYGVATYFAFYNLFSFTSLLDVRIRTAFAFPWFTLIWLTMIILFFDIRTTIASIVENGRWKTLSRIHQRINHLEEEGDLADKDTAERVLRLANIQNQIMSLKTSTFDLDSLATLFRQLLIPLFGLLLGILNKFR